MTTYKIVRRFFNSDQFSPIVISTGLSLQQAQQHCRDLETSYRTCTKAEGLALTEECGPWFDGFEEE